MLRAKGDVKCEVNYFAREESVFIFGQRKSARARERADNVVLCGAMT